MRKRVRFVTNIIKSGLAYCPVTSPVFYALESITSGYKDFLNSGEQCFGIYQEQYANKNTVVRAVSLNTSGYYLNHEGDQFIIKSTISKLRSVNFGNIYFITIKSTRKLGRIRKIMLCIMEK